MKLHIALGIKICNSNFGSSYAPIHPGHFVPRSLAQCEPSISVISYSTYREKRKNRLLYQYQHPNKKEIFRLSCVNIGISHYIIID